MVKITKFNLITIYRLLAFIRLTNLMETSTKFGSYFMLLTYKTGVVYGDIVMTEDEDIIYACSNIMYNSPIILLFAGNNYGNGGFFTLTGVQASDYCAIATDSNDYAYAFFQIGCNK